MSTYDEIDKMIDEMNDVRDKRLYELFIADL